MPNLDLHDKPFDDGTLTKLDVFERYLESWLPVFIHSPVTDEVNICDFFAGTGMDKKGRPGSPLIILKIIDSFKDQIFKKKLKVNIILNDFTKDKYDCLIDTISKESRALCDLSGLLDISYYNSDFLELFDILKAKLMNQNNIIFIDQNGIKYVTEKKILELEKFSRTDYMFFCSSSYAKRFVFEDYLPGLKFSPDIKHAHVHRELLNYYRKMLPENSPTKLYSFTIKKKGNIYGLIFGSKHPLGVDKFLHVVWTKNPLNGDANFDIDDDLGKGQLPLFGKPKLTKIEQFQKQLEKLILSRGSITNKEIYLFTLENGFVPKHAKEILVYLKNINFSSSFLTCILITTKFIIKKIL